MDHTHVDAVIVGAGFSGLYATHRLRNVDGLTVQSFEAGSDPGGVWFWNNYPGARCDFESLHYSYTFDEALAREWRWKERYAAQPEIRAYLGHVADRFDLRRSYRFDTRVVSAVWDDSAAEWVVSADDGSITKARYFINAAGAFGVTKKSDFAGEDLFGGTVVHTSQWPAEGLDLAGKRVAVVGTGSTGIQVIQTIAGTVAELTVFQRTANYACPLGNKPLDDDEFAAAAANFRERRVEARNRIAGAPYPRAVRPAMADSPEERERTYDTYYYGGGFRMLASTYFDLLFDPRANETVADYIRGKIRGRVTDPVTAELLCPDNHPYGAKRTPFETKYYEAFNLPHVRLVDARSTPITAITPTGIATSDGHYEFDVIILATGFDVGAGALTKMGVIGRGGRKLTAHWSNGQRCYLGTATHGFPNLFHINGPQSAAAVFNNPLAIEDSVDFVSGLIAHMTTSGRRAVEATAEAEERYNDMVTEVADSTLIPKSQSWYMGDNIAGKTRTPVSLFTGAPMFRAIVAEVEADNYAGFAFDGAARPVSNLVSLDGAAVFLLAGMLNMGLKSLEEQDLEEARAAMNGFVAFQAPIAPGVHITEAHFTTDHEQRALRVYRPAVDGRLPVLVMLHGGGWIGGGLDAFDEPCADLADRLGVVVVSPDYRLAPENPFPAASDDVLCVLDWVQTHVSDHGGDPSRVAIGGESAGANLATVTALRIRDHGGPSLCAQILVAPSVDAHADTESRIRYATGPFLSTAVGARMVQLYAGDATDVTSPYISPLRAADLSGLPPAFIATMGIDPLRDEGEEYGRALTSAGVTTMCRRFDGLPHTAFSMSGAIPRSMEIREGIAAFLRPILARQTVDA